MPLNDGFKERGLCNTIRHPEIDPETFWPNGVTGPEEVKILKAKRICRQCPVMLECHLYAVAERQYWGIWGGTTEEERREDRRETKRILAERVDRLTELGVAS